jgi:16S rRNA (cytosine1402-N4)-methyltransferase
MTLQTVFFRSIPPAPDSAMRLTTRPPGPAPEEEGAQLVLPLPELAPATEWIWSEEDDVSEARPFVHATVMRDEVVRALAPVDGGVYVDVTLGGGGHTLALLEAAPGARVIAFDKDPSAVEASRARLAAHLDRVTFVPATFSRLEQELRALGVERASGLCADLGASSPQLDDPSRGMSFRHEGPLDMRMDTRQGETALDLVDRLSEGDLADVIFRFGEERRSRRIARSIKRARSEGELKTTLDLRRAVVRAVGPARVGGIDPATRTFQALRIAVNDELGEIEALLGALPRVLRPDAVAAIISFHSLEDRLVKRAFAAQETWTPLAKKPLLPTDEERAANPRSRSAKLRAARLSPRRKD